MISQSNLQLIPAEFRYAAYELPTQKRSRRVKRNTVLWSVQGLLAVVFLFAGAMKLVMPVEELTKSIDLPGALIRFIGVVEVLGAAGLILPGLFKIRTGLTALAAAGLVAVMIGATVLTVGYEGVGPAAVPFVVGILAVYVAKGRSQRLAPVPNTAYAKSLQHTTDASWLAASRSVFGASASQ